MVRPPVDTTKTLGTRWGPGRGAAVTTGELLDSPISAPIVLALAGAGVLPWPGVRLLVGDRGTASSQWDSHVVLGAPSLSALLAASSASCAKCSSGVCATCHPSNVPAMLPNCRGVPPFSTDSLWTTHSAGARRHTRHPGTVAASALVSKAPPGSCSFWKAASRPSVTFAIAVCTEYNQP